ncbi:Lipoate-protein ligase A [Lachnospiraceae bacterium TWA4]|nr:Lipoate-protein ligase A [Lachnospiraceae bacterium TWA4]
MIYYDSKSTDPRYNCALESYLWHNHDDEEILLLWIDDTSVVVGRDQNVFSEVDMQIVGKAGVPVIRRNTNGGTVFHDLGNLNFAIIARSDSKEDDFERFLHPITLALKKLGVNAEIENGSELGIDGFKISENSQKHEIDGWVLHEGTLLFDSDLDILRFYTKQTGAQIISKTNVEASTRRLVTNIKNYCKEDLTIQDLMQVLIEEFIGKDAKRHHLHAPQHELIQKNAMERYAGWEWTFSKNATFKFHKNCFFKGYEAWVDLDVKDGIIEDGHVVSKHIDLHEMQNEIIGKRYDYYELQRLMPNRVNLFF